MTSYRTVLLVCFIQIVAGRNFQNIHKTAQIDNMNRIGNFVRIGPYVKIGPYCDIGDFTNIGSEALISNGSIIGRFCNINQKVSIVNNARVGNYVNIGPHTILHDYCVIRDYAKIGGDAEIFEYVFMNDYSSIEDYVSVGAGSVLDRYSSALYAARIGSNVCIGNYARVGVNAVIEDNAVILNYASVRNGAHIVEREVIVQTPSSDSLYSSCVPLDRIQQSHIDRVINGNDESVNNILLDLMNQQFDQLISTCPSADFNLLQIVKSLYLLKCHGRESYERNCRRRSANVFTGRTVSGINFSNTINMNQNGIFVDGQRYSGDESKQTLSREFHFGSNDNRKILNDEVKDLMIRLLATEQDSQRYERVHNDSYCKMLAELRFKRRPVKCDT